MVEMPMFAVIAECFEGHDFGVDGDAAMPTARVVAGIHVCVADFEHGPLSWDIRLLLSVMFLLVMHSSD